MSWAESRETTRAEDAAYSLLGLFGVFVPLIYGEGRKNSFRRLDRAIDEADITFNVMKKEKTRSKLLESLELAQMHARGATIKAAQTGTCTWLLSQTEYVD
jgi:hypothetical protein